MARGREGCEIGGLRGRFGREREYFGGRCGKKRRRSGDGEKTGGREGGGGKVEGVGGQIPPVVLGSICDVQYCAKSLLWCGYHVLCAVLRYHMICAVLKQALQGTMCDVRY